MTPQDQTRLQQAAQLLNQRRFAEAKAVLEPMQGPSASPECGRFLAAACTALGETSRAEASLRAVLKTYPEHQDSAIDLARLLNATGRHEEALSIFVGGRWPAPRLSLLEEQARALKALERFDDCLEVRRRQAAMSPDNAAVGHNLAAALGDAGRHEDSEAAARAVLAAGGQAPETWLVLGRALQAAGRFDEASEAMDQALARRPDYLDALRDRAQLTWMRTADASQATAVLDRAATGSRQAGAIRALKARVLEYAGDSRAAYDAVAKTGGDPQLEVAASIAAIRFDGDLALAHARKAAAIAPQAEPVQRALIEACLATGNAEEAGRALQPLMTRRPLDQGLLALQWTVWKLMGDERAQQLYDYERMVAGWTIDTPPGWSSLESYLCDLGDALKRLHTLKTHPLDQSLRHGTQTPASLRTSEAPAIKAFFTAIDGPIRRHMDFIGQGDDPLRRRNTGDYRIRGAWSVKLRPEGFHADHFHAQGWLSSACYIELPKAVSDEGRQGWIKFGEPGAPTRPVIAPEHFVRPEPGLLALFPSYMWHGTVPFSGDDTRLTIAFDVVPT